MDGKGRPVRLPAFGAAAGVMGDVALTPTLDRLSLHLPTRVPPARLAEPLFIRCQRWVDITVIGLPPCSQLF